jgi:hypothetical protein
VTDELAGTKLCTSLEDNTMTDNGTDAADVDRMPRGGPDASWLDCRLQTDVLEYTDRYDVPDEVKQYVITALDRMGTRMGFHEKNARTALDLVAGIPTPKILELGAGHGRLSEQILRLHATTEVTVTDLDPTSVRNIAAGELGDNPRVTTKVVDATAIDEPELGRLTADRSTADTKQLTSAALEE